MKTELVPKSHTNTNGLELSPITLNDDYRKKWNVHQNDFNMLTMNGIPVNESIYRKGGILGTNGIDGKSPYYMILKQVEDVYPDHILKMSGSKDGKHLDQRWCIIDNSGIEKKVFDSHKSPYLTGGILYSLDSEYFNIETGESYDGKHSTSIKSENYIFLSNLYHSDKEKQGVWKVDLKTGKYEIFK